MLLRPTRSTSRARSNSLSFVQVLRGFLPVGTLLAEVRAALRAIRHPSLLGQAPPNRFDQIRSARFSFRAPSSWTVSLSTCTTSLFFFSFCFTSFSTLWA